MSGGSFLIIAVIILFVIRTKIKSGANNRIIHSGLHKDSIWSRRILSGKEIEILETHFPYYRNLDQRKRRAFENRIKHYQPSVNFVAMKSCKITQETPLLISATIVMMTFGLNQFKLPMFNDILIFENIYYNASSKAHHKGETDASGRLAFSQHHIMEGFQDYKDNLNLAIHEFAHAMHIQVFKNKSDADKHFSQHLGLWINWIGTNANRKLILRSNYFRTYAHTNTFELFAVASECFFETPERFEQELPEMFSVMVKLYNQNPLIVGGTTKE